LKKRSALQPSFPTFPGGLAGSGLLLLRLTAAADLSWCGYMLFEASSRARVLLVLAILATGGSILLLAGHLTRLAALTSPLIEAIILLAKLCTNSSQAGSWRTPSLFTLAIAIAIACLGPGLFSVDAQRYGRREIIISPPN